MDSSTRNVLIIVLVFVVACLCLGVLCVGGGLLAYREIGNNPQIFDVTAEIPSTPSPVFVAKTPTQTVFNPTPPPASDFLMAEETLKTLENSLVPNSDLRILAERFKGIKNIPETVPDTQAPYSVGAQKNFWVMNSDTNQYSKADAVLKYVTPHLYFWIENGVSYDQADLKRLCEEFENKIYPTDRQFFGSEWTPGIDNDPHLYILYAKDLGQNIAGYFSSSDSIPPQASEYSNTHEMFMVAASQNLGDTYTYGVLAHEFQHMIHWYQDRNEESWLNEGFSELAVYLNGYGAGDKAWLYTEDPDMQLPDWPNDPNPGSRDANYGSSFMFVKYFLDRFGSKATQALVASPENGLDSVDSVLKEINVRDSKTNQVIQADDVFGDWVVTNYLDNPSVGDGRYAYKDYADAPQPSATETQSTCPVDWQNRTVHQYGVDYIQIDCKGSYTIDFEGSKLGSVLPTGAHSGKYAFWSNKGDESDMVLSQSFDLSSVSGKVDFQYSTWYDLETDYDYLYLLASENGQDWKILKTPSCTTENPAGSNYGCGYNDKSNGWIRESVDLSAYAGKHVTLRFEYVTDAAVNGEGFMLDDVSIPQIHYTTDFESNDGGWKAEGFVRIANELPQTFRVSLIKKGSTTTVETIPLDANQKFSVPVVIGSGIDEVILVVSGTTRFTRQVADYRFEIK